MGYRAFAQAIAQELDCSLCFSHEFACDSDVKVQAFLTTMFSTILKHLFMDAAEAACEEKEARDVMQGGANMAVSSVDDLVAGFPCQDVSRLLSNSAALNYNVICEGTKRTGGVFRSILSYLRAHPELESLITENVLGLSRCSRGRHTSNLDHAIHAWEIAG